MYLAHASTLPGPSTKDICEFSSCAIVPGFSKVRSQQKCSPVAGNIVHLDPESRQSFHSKS